MSEALLRVRGLCKRFPVRRGLLAKTVAQVHALEDFDCELPAGRTLGLVGESGSGKTTAGRCLLRLVEPTAGSVCFDGVELMDLGAEAMRRQRRRMQMIFQDPYGSLNPRLNVAQCLTEPMLVHGLAKGSAAIDRAVELLEQVGLSADDLHRYPHQFSGGQRQRIGIARALSVEPRLIVCDEAVSALDVSVQAQVINLLMDIQQAHDLAYVFIAHDLAVVAHMCDAVAVMYLGEVVEEGSAVDIFRNPLHPYTRSLLRAVPPDRPGEHRAPPAAAAATPSPMEPPSAERMSRRFPDHAAAFTGDELSLREVAGDDQDGIPHRVRCARVDVLQEMAAAEPEPIGAGG